MLPTIAHTLGAKNGTAEHIGDRELLLLLDNLEEVIESTPDLLARTSVLSPAQIVDRLAARLDLLEAGRGVDPRQQTLRATIEWSHDLLSADEQRLFARLAVFAGGCTLDGAERVCDAELNTLQALVDKSLVRHTQERFWLLETIREFALERLEDSGEADPLRRRHAGYVLALAEQAKPQLSGVNQAEWLERLEAERDNVRAALAFGLEREPALALRLAGALGRFWWVRGPAEGLAWLERGLESTDVEPDVRAPALAAAGEAAWFVGYAPRALRFFEQALALYRESGDQAGVARTLIRLGPPLSTEGRYHESQRVLEEGLALSRPLGLWDEVAIALQILGANAAYRGDWSMVRSNLVEAVAVGRRRGDLAGLVYSLVNLAEAEWREGDLVEAGSLACEALQAARSIGDDLGTLLVFVDLAIVAAKSGDARRSGLFWGASERLDEALGETMWRRERPEYEEQLGEPGEGFAEGVAEGRRLSVDEAVALALESG